MLKCMSVRKVKENKHVIILLLLQYVIIKTETLI